MDLRVDQETNSPVAGTLEKSATGEAMTREDVLPRTNDYSSSSIEGAEDVAKTRLQSGEDSSVGSPFIRTVKCLESDGQVVGSIAYDLASDTRVVTGPLPWSQYVRRRVWCEKDTACLRARLEQRLGATISRRDMEDALCIVFGDRGINPLADLFDSLPPADGADHVSGLFVALLGAEAGSYTAEVAGLLLRAIVTRAYMPGEKFDHMVVLQGPEGIGKSSFCRLLALDERYYLDGMDDLGDIKRAGECMAGKLVVEVAELAGMTGRSREAIKAAVTRTQDTYRGAYRRDARDHLRTAVLVGTTNNMAFLPDGEKNRRFLPVRCGVIKQTAHPMSPEARCEVELAYAQIIAEMREAGGLPVARPLTLSLQGEESAALVRDDYEEVDPQADAVRDYLEGCASRGVTRVSLAMVMSGALGIEGKAATRLNSRTGSRIAAILDTRCPGWYRMPGRQRVGLEKSARAWEYTGI